MPEPAAIVEWWGPYDTLEDVRREVEQKFVDGHHLLCMALRKQDDPDRPVRCRHLISWRRQTIGENEIIALPSECRRTEDGTPTVYYIGWIASQHAHLTRRATERVLMRHLRPELNENPDPDLPWHEHYCAAVVSWFYPPPVPYGDYEQTVEPPLGFPPVATYNYYGGLHGG